MLTAPFLSPVAAPNNKKSEEERVMLVALLQTISPREFSYPEPLTEIGEMSGNDKAKTQALTPRLS
jgi:hypothetical protein